MDTIEQQIQTIGKELLKLARQEEASLAKTQRWENALLDWCMESPELKIRIFRFIDVFPQLPSADSVIRHIREYFPQNEYKLPQALRTGILLTHPTILTKTAIHHLTHNLFLKIAKLFIVAINETEAMKVLKELDAQGITCSIDLLGEKTTSEQEVDDYFKRYQALIRELGQMKLGPHKQNVSVKLSTLDPNFDPIDPETTSQRVRARLRELIRLALNREVFIHIDMEEYILRDLTLKIVRDLLEEKEFKNGVPLGIVVQAYLKGAQQCLEGILTWAKSLAQPLTIRLVRGAYWDQEIMQAKEFNWPIPVFTQKNETDATFEHLTRRILREVPKVRLALATHNIRSIAHTIALIKSRNIDSKYYEFQLLYGMGAPLMGALRAMNYSPRMYMPIGDSVWGMAYLVRRLLENVSSQSFVRRGIHEKANVDEVLAPPKVVVAPSKEKPIQKIFFQECPPLMFFDVQVCENFQRSLKSVRSQLGQRLPLVIDGRHQEKSERLKTVSPNDGVTVIAHASKAEAHAVNEAIRAAESKFLFWAKKSVEERAQYLRTAAQWMMNNRYELAAMEVFEAGKPWREADADVKEAIDYLNFYAYAAEEIQRDQSLNSLPQEFNSLMLRPRGVTVVIAPWNFPIAILTGMSAAALVTGNTVVLKPAEQSVFCGWKVFEAYRQAGIPDGVVNFLTGEGETIGPLLVEDPRVAVIAFTGSKAVGLDIAKRANAPNNVGRYLKKLIIEMGGKNACIVDETADFDQAIPAVLHSAFSYAGQKCSALSRLIVVNSIYESFMSRLVQAAKSFPVGDPTQPHVKCGPVIEKGAQERILAAIEKGRKTGRILFQADIACLKEGYYVPPTIITDLPENFSLLQEEIFGPVLTATRVKTLDEALQKVNDTDFALTGGIFSRTPSHIEQAKKEFEVGNLYINRSITGAVVGRHPFGGYNMSGTGTKAGGINYLKEFCIERTISENISRHGFAPLEE